jgi:hypothetical protein
MVNRYAVRAPGKPACSNRGRAGPDKASSRLVVSVAGCGELGDLYFAVQSFRVVAASAGDLPSAALLSEMEGLTTPVLLNYLGERRTGLG